jgi:uncharacterized LabA/DUF88 family protein
MQFNTAIFYDIENLIGGYNASSAEILSQLSLIQIDEQIKQKEIGKVSVQRAYADWSISRLGQLKSDMVELGIVPVQLFGFGRGITRNTADIHLAIDAIEVALTKPDITTFVIISGDGGFSYLASKLHEYGKTVIGVGYVRHVNKALEAVTDDFIWLNEPKGLEDPITSNSNGSKTNGEHVVADGNNSKDNSEPVAVNSFNLRSQSHVIAFAKKYKPTRV